MKEEIQKTNDLADEVEYIIIQKENPSDIEDTTDKIIAKLTQNGNEVSDGYMIRIKYKEKD